MTMSRFEVSVDDHRLVQRLRAQGKLKEGTEVLSGFNVTEAVDETGVPGLYMILGASRGRKPVAIQVAAERDRRPVIKGDPARIFRADIALEAEDAQFVRQEKEDVALRLIRTGLLFGRGGSTSDDMLDIAASGGKLRYHGAFPLTVDAATVVGEALDGLAVTAESKVVTDDRFGRIKGLIGVPKKRATTIEAVVGGPILVGQIDGTLHIHELRAEGWKLWDVTATDHWQKVFMDLASKDDEYLKAIAAEEKAGKRKRDRKITPVKPPLDHPDG